MGGRHRLERRPEEQFGVSEPVLGCARRTVPRWRAPIEAPDLRRRPQFGQGLPAAIDRVRVEEPGRGRPRGIDTFGRGPRGNGPPEIKSLRRPLTLALCHPCIAVGAFIKT
jgi:hypothetical protein